MEEADNIKRNAKLNQIKSNLIYQFTKNKAEKFFNQKMYNNVDRETLFTLCLPSFMKKVEERERNDQILISIFLYLIKRFIDLFKHDIMNINEKLDSKFYDSLEFISSNIMYSQFSNNRLLMRYGEEGKKFYFLLKGEVAILIPIKKIVNITINEYKRYIALLIIYKEYKLLIDVLKENDMVFDMDLEFLQSTQNYEKNIDLLQSINILNKDDDEEIDSNKSKKDLKKLLELYLTDEEKKFYTKYVLTKKGKYHGEKDDGIFLSPREYINRINQYYEFDFETLNKNLERLKRIEKEKMMKKMEEEGYVYRKESMDSVILNETKTFLIYDYHRVTELGSGEMFGDQALSSATSQRTATIITLSECHFGFLKGTIYEQSIKEYNEKNRKNRIFYLCNVPIMSSFSYKIIERRYYNNFVFKAAKRKELILSQNEKNKNIILLKEGVFEISFKGTIIDICDLINYYMYKLEKMLKRKGEINLEILKNVNIMNSQRRKIERLFYNDINQEYDNKIFLVNAPSIFGLEDTERMESYYEMEKDHKVEKKSFYSFFEIKGYSMFCEYVLLDKKLFEEEIMRKDKSIIDRRNAYLKDFYEKIIKRLLVMRYGKIWNLFLENGIYNENNGVNIDWSKIDLNQNFIKGIIKLIDAINEHKFLATDLDKDMNKYFEETRIKGIEEKQKLKQIDNKTFYDKMMELLNSKINNESNYQLKGNTLYNFKFLNEENMKKQNEGKNFFKRNNKINVYQRKKQKKYNFFPDDEEGKKKYKIKNKKSFSFIPMNKTIINKRANKKLPRINSSIKPDIKNLYESDKLSKENKIYKKVIKKRVSFYSPIFNSFQSDEKLNLQLSLYDTFKKFGETHLKNVNKTSKVVKFISYERKESNND